MPFSQTQLTRSINNLLHALSIPLSVSSPVELTPSLLIAILESILQTDLPLPSSIRTCAKLSHQQAIQCMKIFLGVIASDILDMDVGIASVDPRKLANGDWDEVVFIGELLCWIARKMRIIGKPEAMDLNAESQAEFERTHVGSPSSRSSVTNTNATIFSLHEGWAPAGSNTSYAPSITTHVEETQLNPLSSPLCIHELDFADPTKTHVDPRVKGGLSPLWLHDEDPANDTELEMEEPFPQEPSLFEPLAAPRPVRYDGWLRQVDEDSEIALFEQSRSNERSESLGRTSSSRRKGKFGENSARTGRSTRNPDRTSKTGPKVDFEISRYAETLELLNKRAELLAQLAALKAETSS